MAGLKVCTTRQGNTPCRRITGKRGEDDILGSVTVLFLDLQPPASHRAIIEPASASEPFQGGTRNHNADIS